MKVELRGIETIRPYEQNPQLNDQAVEAVAKSLQEFGFRQPIVVDPEGVIIVGHTRWKAAQKLGLKQVPVHVATELTLAQVKAYRFADSQTATLAEWNYDLLPLEFKDLAGMDFDLSLLGFAPEELGAILAPSGDEGLTDPDAVPAPPDELITQPGDPWILGNHRLLDGAKVHLCNTDPPYNVKVEPRSNNAIAAGLSSFPASDAHRGLMHHQSFDVARQGVMPLPAPEIVPGRGCPSRSRTVVPAARRPCRRARSS
ncbi:MAG: ParB N-terminal domain-containing protein [Planctomycetota bacterium]|nr:ParB N-terminal domain-containing protein [Planctomycetota bacterium]